MILIMEITLSNAALDKYIDLDTDADFLGKKALIKVSKEGIKKKKANGS